MGTGVRPHRRRESGAGALEYVGTITVAALLVAALVLAIGPGDRIVNAVRVAVCEIFAGEDCGARTSDITEALPACQVYSQDYSLLGEATVFSVNLGAEGKLTLTQEVDPDGTERWLVQESGGGQIGAHIMFGQEGKFGLGEGLNAEAKSVLTADGGRTFEFGSEEEARDYMTAAAQQAGKEAAANASPLPRFADMYLADKITGTSYEQPGDPVSYYMEIGSESSAGATASAAAAGADVSGGNAHVLGAKHEPGRDGESDKTTIYYKGTQELAGQLQVLGQGPDGKVKGEVVLAVTMQDGKPVSAKIEAAGQVRSGFFSSGSMDVPLGGKLPDGAASIGLDGGQTVQGRIALEMDLTNTANVDALADVTESVGMPILPGYGTPGYQDPAESVTNLRDRFTEGGPQEGATLTGQKFEGSEAKFEVGFFAGDLVTFGAGGNVATSTARATDALYYAPGYGLVQWQGCGDE